MPYQKDALKNLDKTKQGPQLKKHHNGTYTYDVSSVAAEALPNPN